MIPFPEKHRCSTCDRNHHSPAGLKQLEKHFNHCAHCGEFLYYEYLLKEDVWALTGLDFHGGVLHLPCVEKLIDRKLTLDDFRFDLAARNGHTINDAVRWAIHQAAAAKAASPRIPVVAGAELGPNDKALIVETFELSPEEIDAFTISEDSK